MKQYLVALAILSALFSNCAVYLQGIHLFTVGEPRKPNQKILANTIALYAPLREEIATRRAHLMLRAPGVSCQKGKLLWQRDTWTQYMNGDDAAPEVVYSGCGSDGGDEYWIPRCIEENVWRVVTSSFPNCFQKEAPTPLHCAAGFFFSRIQEGKSWRAACVDETIIASRSKTGDNCSAETITAWVNSGQSGQAEPTLNDTRGALASKDLPAIISKPSWRKLCLPQEHSFSQILPPHIAKYYYLD